MSGGEMQRVAIARALVVQPEAVLCDEPTGNLDSANSHEILKLLRSLPQEGQRAVVMVTHDPQAAAFGDRTIHLRDGRIESERPTHWTKDAVTLSNAYCAPHWPALAPRGADRAERRPRGRHADRHAGAQLDHGAGGRL